LVDFKMGSFLSKVTNWIKEKKNYIFISSGIFFVMIAIGTLKKGQKNPQIPNEENIGKLLFNNSQPISLLVTTNDVFHFFIF
jgi:hypothetical protein